MADSGKKDFVNIIPRELTKQEISQADSESAMQMQTINAWVEEHYSNQIPSDPSVRWTYPVTNKLSAPLHEQQTTYWWDLHLSCQLLTTMDVKEMWPVLMNMQSRTL